MLEIYSDYLISSFGQTSATVLSSWRGNTRGSIRFDSRTQRGFFANSDIEG